MTIEDRDDDQLPGPDEQSAGDARSPEAESLQASDELAEAAEIVEELVEPAPSLEDQLVDAEARVLRTQAELENFRKRIQRDQASERQYAAMPLVSDLLAVIDNLGRALDAAADASQSEGLIEGVQLVSQQLLSVLSQYGCQQMEVLHEQFDPNLHEAIGQVPSDEYSPGTILEVTQSGYKMHDRMVRAAHVLIAAPQDDQQPPAPDQLSSDDVRDDDEARQD
jgi:molecular chaperone GrpE